jgi:hypothetical protein
MRCSIITSLLLATGAVALPSTLHKRDLATIQSAFANISAQVTALDTGIKSLTPTEDPSAAVQQLTGLSASVVDALTAGTAAVQPTAALGLSDAISLLSSSNTLVTSVNSIVDYTGADGVVVEQLTTQKTASQAFIAAVVSKVPSVVAGLANSQSQAVITALNNGITAFGGTLSRCVMSV